MQPWTNLFLYFRFSNLGSVWKTLQKGILSIWTKIKIFEKQILFILFSNCIFHTYREYFLKILPVPHRKIAFSERLTCLQQIEKKLRLFSTPVGDSQTFRWRIEIVWLVSPLLNPPDGCSVTQSREEADGQKTKKPNTSRVAGCDGYGGGEQRRTARHWYPHKPLGSCCTFTPTLQNGSLHSTLLKLMRWGAKLKHFTFFSIKMWKFFATLATFPLHLYLKRCFTPTFLSATGSLHIARTCSGADR